MGLRQVVSRIRRNVAEGYGAGGKPADTTIGVILAGTRVKFVIPGAPGARPARGSPMQEGDVIVEVDGVPVTGDTVDAAVRGCNTVGSSVRLGVLRAPGAALGFGGGGATDHIECVRKPTQFVTEQKDLYLLLERARKSFGPSSTAGQLIQQVEKRLADLETQHEGMEALQQETIATLEQELEELLTAAYALLGKDAPAQQRPGGELDPGLALMHENAELRRLNAGLESELSSAQATATRLQQQLDMLGAHHMMQTVQNVTERLASAQKEAQHWHARANEFEEQQKERLVSIEEDAKRGEELKANEQRLRMRIASLEREVEELKNGGVERHSNLGTVTDQDARELLKGLRNKHLVSPSKNPDLSHTSTIGLVIDGCAVSAVVPGGPMDRTFQGVRVEPHDVILAVDGVAHSEDMLEDALIGNDIVGSVAMIRLQKAAGPDKGRILDIQVTRGSIETIQALGDLFLMLSDVSASLSRQAAVTEDEIFFIEDQIKVVNDASNTHICALRAHVTDLEEAIIDICRRCNFKLHQTQQNNAREKMPGGAGEVEALQGDLELVVEDLRLALADAEEELQGTRHENFTIKSEWDKKLAETEAGLVESYERARREEVEGLKCELHRLKKSCHDDLESMRLALDDAERQRLAQEMESRTLGEELEAREKELQGKMSLLQQQLLIAEISAEEAKAERMRQQEKMEEDDKMTQNMLIRNLREINRLTLVTKRFSELALKRWMQSGVAKAFESWSQRFQQRKGLRRVIGRWSNHIVASSFGTWHCNISDLLDARQTCHKIILSIQKICTASAFAMWQKRTTSQVQARNVLAKVLLRWHSRFVSAAFGSWHSVSLEQKWLTLACKKAMLRWGKLSLSAPFELWKAMVSERKRLGQAATKLIKRRKMLAVGAPFTCWHANVKDLKRLTRQAVMVVRRWLRRTLAPAFALWQGHWIMCKNKHKMIKNVIKRWLNSKMFRCYEVWRDSCAKRQVFRELAVKCVSRIKHGGHSRAFQGWCQGVCGQKQAKAKANQIVRIWRDRLLSAAFATWGVRLVKIKRANRMGRIVCHLARRYHVRAWDQWKSACTYNKRARQAISIRIERCKYKTLSSIFSTFHVQVVTSVCMKKRCSQVIRRMLNKCAAQVFEEWVSVRINAAENKKALKRASRYIAKMRNQCLSSSFEGWRYNLTSIQRARQRIRGIILKWTCVTLSSALLSWRHNVTVSRRTRNRGIQTVLRWTNALLSSALISWWHAIKRQQQIYRKCKSCLLRMANMTAAKSFELWRQTAKRIVRVRRSSVLVMTRWIQRGVAPAFGSWLLHSKEARRLRRKGLTVATKLMKMHLVRAFEQWRAHNSEINHQQILCMRTLQRMFHRALCQSWAAWLDSIIETKRIRTLTSKMSNRLRHKALLAPFWTWHGLFVQRKRISKTALRVLRGWRFHALCVPFSTWRESASQQVQEKRAVRKIVIRWRRMQLSTPFHTWTLRASEQKRQKIVAEKAILRWKLKQLSVPYLSWHEYTREQKRLSLSATRVLSRWSMKQLSVPYLSWHEYTLGQKRLSLSATRVLSRWSKLSLSIPFCSWSKRVQEQSLMRANAMKLARRWRSLALALPWSTWTSYVSDKKRLRQAGQVVIRRWQWSNVGPAFNSWMCVTLQKKEGVQVALARGQQLDTEELDACFMAWAGVLFVRENGLVVPLHTACMPKSFYSQWVLSKQPLRLDCLFAYNLVRICGRETPCVRFRPKHQRRETR